MFSQIPLDRFPEFSHPLDDVRGIKHPSVVTRKKLELTACRPCAQIQLCWPRPQMRPPTFDAQSWPRTVQEARWQPSVDRYVPPSMRMIRWQRVRHWDHLVHLYEARQLCPLGPNLLTFPTLDPTCVMIGPNACTGTDPSSRVRASIARQAPAASLRAATLN
jgi:hypothetical protein